MGLRFRELATPYAKAVALSARGMLCNLGGDFATGRALPARAATWGARSEHLETSQINAACAFYLGLQDGTAAELEPFILEAAHRVPTHRAWEAARLKLLLETGRRKELARALPELARHGKDIPRDRHWLVTMALLAECSWELRATEWCGPLQEALEPFSGLLIVVGRASLCYGSVDHFRGLLALARGDLHRAESLLERALAQHERIASPPWVAETQAALAALAAGRRDREGAVSWLDRAVATAERLGMRSLLRRAEAIRATLPEGPHA